MLLPVIIAAMVVLLCSGCVSADLEGSKDDVGTVDQPVPQSRPAEDKGDDTSNVSAELLSLYKEFEAHQQEGSSEAFRPRDPALRVRDGAVLIDCTAAGDGAALRRSLEALGLVEGAVYRHAVSGWLPITAIPSLSQLKELGLARAAMSATGESPGD